MIGRDPADLFYGFTIDQGSLSGIEKNDPVITDRGLVGWVSAVYPTYSLSLMHIFSLPAGQNRAYSQPAPEQKEKSTLDQEIMEFFQSGEAEE